METLKAIELRKSTRGFKPDQVTKADVEVLLQAANQAPIGMGAFDSVHLTVIQDRSLLDRISAATTAGTAREGTDIYYGGPALIVISSLASSPQPVQIANAAALVQTIMLAATDLGLGSVYVFGTVQGFQSDPTLAAATRIPEGYVPASSVVVGYPTEQAAANPKPVRTLATNWV